MLSFQTHLLKYYLTGWAFLCPILGIEHPKLSSFLLAVGKMAEQ